ncbi:hypothetical protein HYFRA_00002699 [Hymenoscyphus fraxineus]|uniref:Uncharacterized protein n=1 Tax=Hymenoscyphus fraxineus TaxID=746836 RepID=A0A9N9L9T6_9HELO|nr:hypothetical protein HYFRA_00002699 [Hymenoscyphus fraxineus]
MKPRRYDGQISKTGSPQSDRQVQMSGVSGCFAAARTKAEVEMTRGVEMISEYDASKEVVMDPRGLSKEKV